MPPPRHPAPLREPHLLRFRLRQLFFLVTVLSVLCALLVLTEGPWPLVIGVTTALIAAHVFGTMVGTRLRDTSAEVLNWRAGNPAVNDDTPLAGLELDPALLETLPPQTPLADHAGANRWLLWFVVGGAIVGAIVGGTLLALTMGARIGWAGWVVGTLSCGVLGTWAAFLASSFSVIARQAWRHAEEKGR